VARAQARLRRRYGATSGGTKIAAVAIITWSRRRRIHEREYE